MIGDANGNSNVDGKNVYKERAEPVLVFLSNSYSELDSISVYVSRSLSRSKKVDLIYFIFIFYFLFNLFFQFSIFRTTRVRVDQLCHHISHLMV